MRSQSPKASVGNSARGFVLLNHILRSRRGSSSFIGRPWAENAVNALLKFDSGGGFDSQPAVAVAGARLMSAESEHAESGSSDGVFEQFMFRSFPRCGNS